MPSTPRCAPALITPVEAAVASGRFVRPAPLPAKRSAVTLPFATRFPDESTDTAPPLTFESEFASIASSVEPIEPGSTAADGVHWPLAERRSTWPLVGDTEASGAARSFATRALSSVPASSPPGAVESVTLPVAALTLTPPPDASARTPLFESVTLAPRAVTPPPVRPAPALMVTAPGPGAHCPEANVSTCPLPGIAAATVCPCKDETTVAPCAPVTSPESEPVKPAAVPVMLMPAGTSLAAIAPGRQPPLPSSRRNMCADGAVVTPVPPLATPTVPSAMAGVDVPLDTVSGAVTVTLVTVPGFTRSTSGCQPPVGWYFST